MFVSRYVNELSHHAQWEIRMKYFSRRSDKDLNEASGVAASDILDEDGSVAEGSSVINHDISISVKVFPVESESNISANVYAFAYTVMMENKGTSICQLVNRHWKVYSADRQIADVKGEGVVGQQPILRPLDSFEYTSWTLIQDPVGFMKGSYTFRSENGDFFDVEIEKFDFSFRDRPNVH